MDVTTELMVITMEECGELIQECSKLLRKRYVYKRNKMSQDTKDSLTKEIGDVKCMLSLIEEIGFVDEHEVTIAMDKKREQLKKWSSLITYMDAKMRFGNEYSIDVKKTT